MKHLSTAFMHYGIGVNPLTENDFWNIAEQESITVVESDHCAFSFVCEGRKFIAIPKQKRGLRRLFTMFHELGHLLLMNGKEPMAAFQGLAQCDHDKAEAEADAVALIALIPKHLIEELAGEYGETRYGRKIWQERCRLFFLYGA